MQIQTITCFFYFIPYISWTTHDHAFWTVKIFKKESLQMNITTCIYKMNYQKNFIWSEWNQASFYLKKTFFDTAYCIKEINYCVQTFEYEITIQDKKHPMIAIIMTKNKCYYKMLYFGNKGNSFIGTKQFIATLPIWYVRWNLTFDTFNSK